MITEITYILSNREMFTGLERNELFFCTDLGRFQTTGETESMPNARESGGTL